ncbi:MAG: phenylacetate--CoA ligase family protein [Verrucomicrobia bacterium]|nr:phenylacetate--CoA ligase family protein [Verrucomicrobiota bacterium]
MSLEDRLYPLLGLYERLPESVRQGLGWCYRRLPARMRWGRSYLDFRRLAEESESWNAEEIEAYQIKQLRRTLHHAMSTCPYYQSAFLQAGFKPEHLQNLRQLSICPTLEKRNLIDHLPNLVSREVPESKRLYITTGGSTGVPAGFYLEKGVSRPKEQAFLEAMWRRAGYEDGLKLAVIRGHVTSSDSKGRIVSHDPTRNWLMLSSYHLMEDRLSEYLEALETFRPEMLHAYPSAALQLAEFLERHGQSWRIPLRAVLCGSERLTLPQKRMLERVFGCRVYRWYGHAERVVLAGEGRKSEWFHFFPAYGLVEFGPPDEEGLREIIGTSFHNQAMPLIRYRTGDLARLAEDSDSVRREWPWPAVVEVVGRDQEFLLGAHGRRISLTAFNMHDDVFDGLYAVQFFQEEPGKVEFRFVPGPQFHRSRLERVEQGIRRKLGDDFQLVLREVKEVEKTARGKHRWLVSTLPGAGLRS